MQEDAEQRSRAAVAQQEALAAASAGHKQALAAELAAQRDAAEARLSAALSGRDATIAGLQRDAKAGAEALDKASRELADAVAAGQLLRRQLDTLAESSLRERQHAQAEHAAAVRLMKDDHAGALAAAARQLDARVAQ